MTYHRSYPIDKSYYKKDGKRGLKLNGNIVDWYDRIYPSSITFIDESKSIVCYIVRDGDKEALVVNDSNIEKIFSLWHNEILHPLPVGDIIYYTVGGEDGQKLAYSDGESETLLLQPHEHVYELSHKNGKIFYKVEDNHESALAVFDGEEEKILSNRHDMIRFYEVEKDGLIYFVVRDECKEAVAICDEESGIEKIISNWHRSVGRIKRLGDKFYYIVRDEKEALAASDGKEKIISGEYDDIESFKFEGDLVYYLVREGSWSDGKVALMLYDGEKEKRLSDWYDNIFMIHPLEGSNGVFYYVMRKDGKEALAISDGDEKRISSYYDDIKKVKQVGDKIWYIAKTDGKWMVGYTDGAKETIFLDFNSEKVKEIFGEEIPKRSSGLINFLDPSSLYNTFSPFYHTGYRSSIESTYFEELAKSLYLTQAVKKHAKQSHR